MNQGGAPQAAPGKIVRELPELPKGRGATERLRGEWPEARVN